MQVITPSLTALLKEQLQAGRSGFGGYARINGQNLRCQRISLDKSLRMQADQFEIVLDNEDLRFGWGPTSVFHTNQRVRIYQWYGPRSNRVQTFDGIIDNVADGRDLLTVTITGRDRFGIAIDQTFAASAPQQTGETGAVRTEDNGVYVNREVSYIVNDIMDRIGWPTGDRDILATSMVLAEFILSDGSSYADNMMGTTQLTGLVGYDLWADELGIVHFRPTPSSDLVEVPVPAAFTWRTGEDVVDLGNVVDQYELITRVKTTGPMTVLTDAWHLLWQTQKISQPVGIWYDPAFPSSIRVIDAATKKLFTVRDSDHQVVSSVYLGGPIPHPLGITGDPSDETHYYVLNAPWYYGGGTSGNTIKKVRKADNVVVATFAIPDGRWSAIKMSAAFLWMTNLDTDHLYKRDKTDASAIANYRPTYQSVLQSNPSGLMIDGTTLHVFWANGGTTNRFLNSDESAPNTITSVTATSGTNLHGGEMNTTTHTECWGDSDSAGLVAKFSLVSPTTKDVTAEAIDIALEDELGANAELQDRVHDAHPGDPAHPWESRRLALGLDKINNLAQAGDVAQFQLDKLGRRRQVVNVGILGNPAIQKNDLVRIEDPKTAHFQSLVMDTYRSDMAETYLGTVSLIRGGVANDTITEPNPPPPDDSGGDGTGVVTEPGVFFKGSFPVYGDAIRVANSAYSDSSGGFAQVGSLDTVTLTPGVTYSYDITLTLLAGGYTRHFKLINDDLGSPFSVPIGWDDTTTPGIPNDAGTFHVTGTFVAPLAAGDHVYRFDGYSAVSPHGHQLAFTVDFDVEPV